ncbi:MAG: sugar phosphate isomerase/epimerase [Sedimentisphaerales bacterium]|nr:sugar phosphate isomerase/epimerase [Sedimentisphaerales bacterium]
MDINLNRRDFLKVMGACTAAGMASTSCADLEKKAVTSPQRWKMRLSTSSILFMQLPIEQACEKISNLGYEAIDIWSAHNGCPHLDDVAERLGPDGLKKLLTKNNLKLFSFSVYKGGYQRYAGLLGDVGGGVAVRGSAPPCTPDELTEKMKKFLGDLKPLADLAARHNSYLAIENHVGALLCTLDSLKAFVDMNTSPRLGIALAPYHIQSIKASVPEAIRICGKQLFYFYAWQNFSENRQLPGIGTTYMVPWIQALADIKYSGYVNPFMHGDSDTDVMSANLAKSRDYLIECFKRTDKQT